MPSAHVCIEYKAGLPERAVEQNSRLLLPSSGAGPKDTRSRLSRFGTRSVGAAVHRRGSGCKSEFPLSISVRTFVAEVIDDPRFCRSGYDVLGLSSRVMSVIVAGGE